MLLKTHAVKEQGLSVVELSHCALLLRVLLVSVTSTLPSPPFASDLTEENVQLPPALYNFLCLVLGFSDG